LADRLAYVILQLTNKNIFPSPLTIRVLDPEVPKKPLPRILQLAGSNCSPLLMVVGADRGCLECDSLENVTNDVEALSTHSSSNEKIDAVGEIADVFVDLKLYLLPFIYILLLFGYLFVEYVCEAGTGVRVVVGTEISVGEIELELRLLV
jgi:hypothetical protein